MILSPHSFPVLDSAHSDFYASSYQYCARYFQFRKAGIHHHSYAKEIDVARELNNWIVDALYPNEILPKHSFSLGGGVYLSIPVHMGKPIVAIPLYTPGKTQRIAHSDFIPRNDLLFAGLVANLTQTETSLVYVAMDDFGLPIPLMKKYLISVSDKDEIIKKFNGVAEETKQFVTAIATAIKMVDESGDILLPPPKLLGTCYHCPHKSTCVRIHKTETKSISTIKTFSDRI